MGKIEADYVIVGAGAAGCLLANRLCADPVCRVILLEAGSRDWNPLIRVPMLAGLLYYLPSLNWGYETSPQAHLGDRRIVWPRGKVLGGSTAINGMMYMRGRRDDYRRWRLSGLDGWDYEDVLPAFKAFERNVSHLDGDLWHGRLGELFTEKALGRHPLYRAWIAAALEAGCAWNEDFNGADQEGVGLYDFNIRAGRRMSAASAFITPIRRKSNFSLMTGTQVERLRFHGRRCVGVDAILHGERIEVAAAREVVVCAGAVNSPQLLMLSGIGDGARLAELGIAPVLHRPAVGENLQDHLGIYLQHRSKTSDTLYGLMRPDRAVAAGLTALLFGRGPAASVPLEAGGFLKTRPDLELPDVHVTFVPGLSLAASQSGQMEHGFLTNAYQLRPESRGSIRLASPVPKDKPAIQPNYLSAEADRRCLRDALRLCRRIASQGAMDAVRGEERSPGAEVTDDEQVDRWISQTAQTIFHPVGTCRMGADPDAVLDSRLRVRGVEGLRVADASSMPDIIGGNTSAPTMMIAERAASFMVSGL
jgi:choline dehydrogenase